MITKLRRDNGVVAVTFSAPPNIRAQAVYLVGTFNNWNEQSHPLILTPQGWQTTLELAAGQLYEYRYLVDGTRWHNDWQADQYVPNAYGGANSAVNLSQSSAERCARQYRARNQTRASASWGQRTIAKHH